MSDELDPAELERLYNDARDLVERARELADAGRPLSPRQRGQLRSLLDSLEALQAVARTARILDAPTDGDRVRLAFEVVDGQA